MRRSGQGGLIPGRRSEVTAEDPGAKITPALQLYLVWHLPRTSPSVRLHLLGRSSVRVCDVFRLLSHWTPGCLHSHRQFVLDRDGQERRSRNLEIGKCCRDRPGDVGLVSLNHLLE